MLEKIFKFDVDVVISDFKLNDMKEDIDYAVEYDGVELIYSILNIKKRISLFRYDFYDTDAIHASEDVNKVYDKEVLNGSNHQGDDPFLLRLKSQCDKYRKKIADAQEELQFLIEDSNKRKLTLKEEEQLKELDDFLESSIRC